MFLVKSKLLLTTYLFIVFYRSTTLQSQLFLKNIDNFLCKQKFVNNHSIPLMQQPQNHDAFSKIQLRSFLKNIENIILINTLLLYIPLLSLTHRQNDRQRSKYTCCAWAGGTFFPVVLLYQFLVLAGCRFWFHLLCTYVLRVQYNCGVVLVFWFWREIVFGVTYELSVQYSCAVVSVFWLWREIVL